MLNRLRLVFLLSWLLVPALAYGQSTEHDEVEVIHNPDYKPSGKKPDLDEVARLIVEKTNAFRQEEGRTKVEVNPKLAETARYFAGYMARTDRFGHTADGNRPSQRARKHGYDYCLIEENIAYEYSSAGFETEDLARRFVEGWKHSPPHRRNMLDADVIETGVAVAQSEHSGYFFAVQMFGRPKSRAIEFKVANRSDETVEYRVGERTFPLPPGYTRTHTRCRPGEVTFQLPGEAPGSKGESRTLRISNGETFAITGEKGKVQVKKE